MKRTKKVLAFLMTIVLCVGMLPMSAFAEGGIEYSSSNVNVENQSVQETITDENATAEDEIMSDEEQTVTEDSFTAGESASIEEEASNIEETTSLQESSDEEKVSAKDSDTEATDITEDSAEKESDIESQQTVPVQESDVEEHASVNESDTETVTITEDSTGKESDVETQQTEEEPVMVSRNSVTLLNASDTVTVSVEGVQDTSQHAITLGELNETNNSLVIEGYDFVRAQVGVNDNFTPITGLYKIADSDEYYATIENNTTTGIRISNPLDVVLVYETHRDTYTVTYEVWVDGDKITENTDSILTLTGASTVKSGSNLEFAAVVQDGYVLNEGSPSATSGSVTGGTNNTYTVTGITENVTIKFELTESTRYNMSFNGSNTTLTYNGRAYDSNSTGNAYTWSYTSDEEIEFALKGRNEYTTTAKILNQLSISIDGVSVAAEIPDTTDDSAVTTIAKGYEVTVTKNNAGQYPLYTVKITNPAGGKVRGAIHIQTNFKDYNSSEVWAKQLDGVDPLAYSYGSGYNKTYVTEDGKGDQDSRLQPDVYTYFARNGHKNQDSTYYINLTGEYSADDLYLTVMNYSAERNQDAEWQGNIIENVRLSELSTVTDSNSALSGYDYQFVIPADDNSSGSGNYYLSTSSNGEEYNGTIYQRYRWFGGYRYEQVSNPQYDNLYYYRVSNNNYQPLWWVQRDSGSSYVDEYVDIRIYIQYKPDADATYSVRYELDGGDGEIGGGSNLHVDDSFVISEELPTKENYVFDGWYLGDNQDTLYQPGDLFTITNDNINLANSNHEFVFTAKWTLASEAAYAPFQVQIFFQKDDGSYDENNPDLSTSERGRVGTQAYIIPEALNDYLDRAKPGWDEEYVYDRQDTDDPIAENGSTVLKIFYKQSVFYVYHTGVEGGNVETIKISSLKDGTYDLTQNLTANTLYGGYYLNYENSETGEAYDGSNTTWMDPQTENGKAMHPEAGETYYVKEVPTTYLQATQISTYHRYTLQLRTMILTTVIDDANYKEVGFRFNDTDYDKTVNVMNLSDSLTFEMPERNGTITTETVDVGDLSNNKIRNGKIAAYDYFNYVDEDGNVDYSSVIGTNRIKAYWVTPDGITVTGGYQRTLIVRDADKDSIIEVDGTVDGQEIQNKEIMYLDAKSAVQILKR